MTTERDNRALKLLEQAPLPQLVESLSASLADAQNNLNLKAIETIKAFADPKNAVQLPGDTQKRSLLELGFEPSFLHITEATITARVAFSMAESQEFSVGAHIGVGIGVFSASINASYTNKYSFESQGASEIKTRIVNVPTPPALAERLRLAAIAASGKNNTQSGGGS